MPPMNYYRSGFLICPSREIYQNDVSDTRDATGAATRRAIHIFSAAARPPHAGVRCIYALFNEH